MDKLNFSQISHKILNEYAVRKSKTQKEEFIDYVISILEKSGYKKHEDINVEKHIGLRGSKNIVIGNPEAADVIIGAHYDTSIRSIFPNWVVSKKHPVRIPVSITKAIGVLILVFIVEPIIFFITLIILLSAATQNPLYIKTILLITLFLGILFCYWLLMIGGPSNKNNANDNTSGVLTLLKMLIDLPETYRKKVCIIFFDNEEKGLWGSKNFVKAHKKAVKNKLMINFDSVGCGNNIVITSRKAARNDLLYEELLASFNKGMQNKALHYIGDDKKSTYGCSDNCSFRKSVSVYALNRSRHGILYIDRIHTKRDVICRMENINILADIMISYIKQIGVVSD